MNGSRGESQLGWGELLTVTMASGLLLAACSSADDLTGDGSGDGGSPVGGGGSGAGTGASSPDGGGCPADPPAAPAEEPCQSWQCEPVAEPACWQCDMVPASEGAECSSGASTGACMDGVCEPMSDPSAPGTMPWSTWTHQLEVAPGTTIALTIYGPDDPGPFPVVVFTHGFMLGPDLYASHGQHLASWGYVVVLPAMPGSLFSSPTHTELAAYLTTILDWIGASGLDPAGPLQGKADPNALGLSGHSMGGKISLLLSSADSRPQAIFAVDPVDAAGSPLANDPADYPSVTPELMPQIAIPLGLLGETVNAQAGFGGQACAPAEDNFHQYFLHAQSPAIEIEILGANHMSFLDNPNCGLTCSMCSAGTDDPAITRQLTRGYLTAFFQVFLQDQSAYQVFLTGAPMAEQVSSGLVLSETKNGF